MKTIITRNTEAKTGYAMIEIAEDGTEKVTLLDKSHTHSKTGIVTIDLPKNTTNRLCINPSKLEKELANADSYELPYKDESEKRTLGNGKKIEDYITDEEKKIIDEIYAKAKARKEADKPKELTPLEKAQLEVEKAQKRLEKLLAQETKA